MLFYDEDTKMLFVALKVSFKLLCVSFVVSFRLYFVFLSFIRVSTWLE